MPFDREENEFYPGTYASLSASRSSYGKGDFIHGSEYIWPSDGSDTQQQFELNFENPSDVWTIAMWLKGGKGEFKIGSMYERKEGTSWR